MQAAVSAGLVAALVQTGMLALSAERVIEIVPGFKLAPGQTSVLTPAFIAFGVLRGARVAALAVIVAHIPLRLSRV